MNHLELFSGTHSFGKVSSSLGYDVVSLDRDIGAKDPTSDYISKNHIQSDIMEWDYKTYPVGYFHLITASPVCLWWSRLRFTCIGRKLKGMDRPLTREDIENDVNKYGKPMVDKIMEIIEYFKPKYYIIENPDTGRMKEYITELPYNIFDYCKFSNWGYQKKTRFWNNIPDLDNVVCKKDCENIVVVNNQKLHSKRMGTSKTVIDNGKIIRVNTAALRKKYKDYSNIQQEKKKDNPYKGQTNKLERYRIPSKLIEILLKKCIYSDSASEDSESVEV